MNWVDESSAIVSGQAEHFLVVLDLEVECEILTQAIAAEDLDNVNAAINRIVDKMSEVGWTHLQRAHRDLLQHISTIMMEGVQKFPDAILLVRK